MGCGKKHDDGKLRYDLIPHEVEEELAKVLTFGARKYDDNNWQGVGFDRYLAALRRHLAADRRGELLDEESGFLHLSHALCCLAFMVWKRRRESAEASARLGSLWVWEEEGPSIERELDEVVEKRRPLLRRLAFWRKG